MGFIAKIKTWWKMTPIIDRISLIVDGVSILGVGACLYSLKHTEVRVTFVQSDGSVVDIPKHEEMKEITDENLHYSPRMEGPIEDRSQFEMAANLFNGLEGIDGKLYDLKLKEVDGIDAIMRDLEKSRDEALNLTWDLAASEDRLEDCGEVIPTQLYD